MCHTYEVNGTSAIETTTLSQRQREGPYQSPTQETITSRGTDTCPTTTQEEVFQQEKEYILPMTQL